MSGADMYKPGIGVVAGALRLKWNVIDQHIHMLSDEHIMIKSGDNVNVFINFESIINNLTTRSGLNTQLNYYKQNIVLELESSILNLIANYRSYFIKEKCNVKVYLYHTSMDKNYQHQMRVYNKYYRDYYYNRYNQNPQFRELGNILNKIIIPDLKLILLYVPRCYFLESQTYDGSIIPYIISTLNPDDKNVIITADIFDTLYMFNPNFNTIYIKRKFKEQSITSDIESTIPTIIKNESPFDLSVFRSELYYRLLLSIKGSKIRNIRSAKGFGYSKFMKILKDGMENGVILKDFSSLDSIIELMPKDYREDIKQAFMCTSIENQYNLLSSIDIEQLKSQIIDKIDMPSIEALNNRRFIDYPINLPMLIG